MSRDAIMSREASNSSNASNRNSNSRNASNSRNSGNSSDTAIARTPVKGGTARVPATHYGRYGKHLQQRCMPQEHRCQQHQNTKTLKTKTTTGNISDAVNIMDASNSKEPIAGTPVKVF
jgi:hypothetical protein